MAVKLTKSEVSLIKRYCSRASDEDLSTLSSYLPQTFGGDRAFASEILQADKEMDTWLVLASGVDELFVKMDSIGEFASIEREARSNKKASK